MFSFLRKGLYGKINVINLSRLVLPGVGVNLRLNLENPDFFIKEKKIKKELRDKIVMTHKNFFLLMVYSNFFHNSFDCSCLLVSSEHRKC